MPTELLVVVALVGVVTIVVVVAVLFAVRAVTGSDPTDGLLGH